MFDTKIPPVKEPLNISIHENFFDKVMAVYEYAKIRDIFLEISNTRSIDKSPITLLKVININIPHGSLSFINGILKECYNTLSDEAASYIQGDDDFDTITKTIEACIEKCSNGAEEHNIHVIFTFDQNLNFNVYKSKKWYRVPYQYLQWTQQYLHEDFKEHFNIRKGFFDKLGMAFDKTLKLHLSKPGPTKMPYKWNSENPELQITELLYIIYRISGQLEIDFKSGGSFAKFKREFFNLFGLSDKDYDKKVTQILARKRGEHFMRKLVEKFEENHAKLFEVKK